MLRTDWHQLAEPTRSAIESRSGRVVHATTAAEGLNSALALLLDTDNGTKLFVKGLRTDHPGVVTQNREAMIAPHLGEIAPRLRWQVEVDGWNLLAFDRIDGRHADYSPGSPDVEHVIDAINVMSKVQCPDVAVKLAEKRWGGYVDTDDERALLCGEALLHTDYNPANVLINGSMAYLIDWAWPTRGAAWIDPACLVVRLIAAGNAPADAELLAGRATAWAEASTESLDIFSRALYRMWSDIAQHDPASWKTTMQASARAWMDHRLCLIS